MTPDEVVKNLQDLLKDDWDLMRWKEAEQAFRTAISLLQDYQKLRDKIDVGKIQEAMRHCDCGYSAKVAQAIVTYLLQPTEHWKGERDEMSSL